MAAAYYCHAVHAMQAHLHPQRNAGQGQLLGDLHCHAQPTELDELEPGVLVRVDPQAPLQGALLSCQQHVVLFICILVSALRGHTPVSSKRSMQQYLLIRAVLATADETAAAHAHPAGMQHDAY